MFFCAALFIKLLFKRKISTCYNWKILLYILTGFSSWIRRVTSCILSAPQENTMNVLPVVSQSKIIFFLFILSKGFSILSNFCLQNPKTPNPMSLIIHYCLSISMKVAANIIGNRVNLNEIWQGLVHQCSETAVDTPTFHICWFLMLMKFYWTKTLVSKACPLLAAFYFPRKFVHCSYGTRAWGNDLGVSQLKCPWESASSQLPYIALGSLAALLDISVLNCPNTSQDFHWWLSGMLSLTQKQFWTRL